MCRFNVPHAARFQQRKRLLNCCTTLGCCSVQGSIMQQPLPFIHHKKTEVRVAPVLKRKRIIHDDDCDDPVVVSSASSAPNVSAAGPADAQLLSQQQLIGPTATSDPVHDDGCSAIDVSSDSGSSDEDDPVSRKARKLAVCNAQHRQAQFSAKTLKDYFGPISCDEYICNLDHLTKTCIMDLRFVVPVTNAHNLESAIGGSLSASTSGSSSSSESGSSSPQKLKNGYVIDDFIVDTDDGSCSSHSGSD